MATKQIISILLDVQAKTTTALGSLITSVETLQKHLTATQKNKFGNELATSLETAKKAFEATISSSKTLKDSIDNLSKSTTQFDENLTKQSSDISNLFQRIANVITFAQKEIGTFTSKLQQISKVPALEKLKAKVEENIVALKRLERSANIDLSRAIEVGDTAKVKLIREEIAKLLETQKEFQKISSETNRKLETAKGIEVAKQALSNYQKVTKDAKDDVNSFKKSLESLQKATITPKQGEQELSKIRTLYSQITEAIKQLELVRKGASQKTQGQIDAEIIKLETLKQSLKSLQQDFVKGVSSGRDLVPGIERTNLEIESLKQTIDNLKNSLSSLKTEQAIASSTGNIVALVDIEKRLKENIEQANLSLQKRNELLQIGQNLNKQAVSAGISDRVDLKAGSLVNNASIQKLIADQQNLNTLVKASQEEHKKVSDEISKSVKSTIKFSEALNNVDVALKIIQNSLQSSKGKITSFSNLFNLISKNIAIIDNKIASLKTIKVVDPVQQAAIKKIIQDLERIKTEFSGKNASIQLQIEDTKKLQNVEKSLDGANKAITKGIQALGKYNSSLNAVATNNSFQGFSTVFTNAGSSIESALLSLGQFISTLKNLGVAKNVLQPLETEFQRLGDELLTAQNKLNNLKVSLNQALTTQQLKNFQSNFASTFNSIKSDFDALSNKFLKPLSSGTFFSEQELQQAKAGFNILSAVLQRYLKQIEKALNTPNLSSNLSQSFKKSATDAQVMKSQVIAALKSIKDASERFGSLNRIIINGKPIIGSLRAITEEGALLSGRMTQMAKAFSKAFGTFPEDAEKTLKQVRELEQEFVRFRSGVVTWALGLSLLGQAIITPLKEAITTTAEFEDTLTLAASIANATSTEFELMANAAKNLGAITRFTSLQAAEGLQNLARAGFNAVQSVTALPVVLDLAQASSIDLGKAAEIVTNIMNSFTISVEDVGRASDILTKAVNTSNATIERLGFGFTYIGSIARSIGAEFQDIIGAMAQLNSAGFKGTLSGTALRGALDSLFNPTKDEARVLAELSNRIGGVGLQLKNASGNFVGFTDLIRQLESAGLTAEEALRLFGQRAGPGMAALLGQGSKSLKDYVELLENSEGTTAKLGERMLKTLKGVALTLKSAVEALSEDFGHNLENSLKGILSTLTNFVNRVIAVRQALGPLTVVVDHLLAAFASLAAVIGVLTFSWFLMIVPAAQFLAFANLLAGVMADIAVKMLTGARAQANLTTATKAATAAMAAQGALTPALASKFDDFAASFFSFGTSLKQLFTSTIRIIGVSIAFVTVKIVAFTASILSSIPGLRIFAAASTTAGATQLFLAATTAISTAAMTLFGLAAIKAAVGTGLLASALRVLFNTFEFVSTAIASINFWIVGFVLLAGAFFYVHQESSKVIARLEKQNEIIKASAKETSFLVKKYADLRDEFSKEIKPNVSLEKLDSKKLQSYAQKSFDKIQKLIQSTTELDTDKLGFETEIDKNTGAISKIFVKIADGYSDIQGRQEVWSSSLSGTKDQFDAITKNLRDIQNVIDRIATEKLFKNENEIISESLEKYNNLKNAIIVTNGRIKDSQNNTRLTNKYTQERVDLENKVNELASELVRHLRLQGKSQQEIETRLQAFKHNYEENLGFVTKTGVALSIWPNKLKLSDEFLGKMVSKSSTLSKIVSNNSFEKSFKRMSDSIQNSINSLEELKKSIDEVSKDFKTKLEKSFEFKDKTLEIDLKVEDKNFTRSIKELEIAQKSEEEGLNRIRELENLNHRKRIGNIESVTKNSKNQSRTIQQIEDSYDPSKKSERAEALKRTSIKKTLVEFFDAEKRKNSLFLKGLEVFKKYEQQKNTLSNNSARTQIALINQVFNKEAELAGNNVELLAKIEENRVSKLEEVNNKLLERFESYKEKLISKRDELKNKISRIAKEEADFEIKMKKVIEGTTVKIFNNEASNTQKFLSTRTSFFEKARQAERALNEKRLGDAEQYLNESKDLFNEFITAANEEGSTIGQLGIQEGAEFLKGLSSSFSKAFKETGEKEVSSLDVEINELSNTIDRLVASINNLSTSLSTAFNKQSDFEGLTKPYKEAETLIDRLIEKNALLRDRSSQGLKTQTTEPFKGFNNNDIQNLEKFNTLSKSIEERLTKIKESTNSFNLNTGLEDFNKLKDLIKGLNLKDSLGQKVDLFKDIDSSSISDVNDLNQAIIQLRRNIAIYQADLTKGDQKLAAFIKTNRDGVKTLRDDSDEVKKSGQSLSDLSTAYAKINELIVKLKADSQKNKSFVEASQQIDQLRHNLQSLEEVSKISIGNDIFSFGSGKEDITKLKGDITTFISNFKSLNEQIQQNSAFSKDTKKSLSQLIQTFDDDKIQGFLSKLDNTNVDFSEQKKSAEELIKLFRSFETDDFFKKLGISINENAKEVEKGQVKITKDLLGTTSSLESFRKTIEETLSKVEDPEKKIKLSTEEADASLKRTLELLKEIKKTRADLQDSPQANISVNLNVEKGNEVLVNQLADTSLKIKEASDGIVSANKTIVESNNGLAVTLARTAEEISSAIGNIGSRVTAQTGGMITSGGVKRFAKGGFTGKVPGSGLGDKIPALLEPGEFVVKRSRVSQFGFDFFKKLNENGKISTFDKEFIKNLKKEGMAFKSGGFVPNPSSMFSSFTLPTSSMIQFDKNNEDFNNSDVVEIRLNVGDKKFPLKSPRNQVTDLVTAMKSLERGLAF